MSVHPSSSSTCFQKSHGKAWPLFKGVYAMPSLLFFFFFKNEKFEKVKYLDCWTSSTWSRPLRGATPLSLGLFKRAGLAGRLDSPQVPLNWFPYLCPWRGSRAWTTLPVGLFKKAGRAGRVD